MTPLATPPSHFRAFLQEVVWLFSGPLGVVLLLAGLLALFARYGLPRIAAGFQERSPEARAGLDAALGLSVVLLPMLVLVLFSPVARGSLDMLGSVGLVAGVPVTLGVAWGSRHGTRPSGGADDLTGGKARVLGAMLGLVVAGMLAALG